MVLYDTCGHAARYQWIHWQECTQTTRLGFYRIIKLEKERIRHTWYDGCNEDGYGKGKFEPQKEYIDPQIRFP